MTKYRPNNKLTQEQREEIAHLVNTGIPHSHLAREYGVSVANISVISRQKSKWIPKESIAQTQDSQFFYAQQIYAHQLSLSDRARRCIEEYVFRPFANQAADFAPFNESPYTVLARSIFRKPELLREEPLELHKRLSSYALEILKYGAELNIFCFSKKQMLEKIVTTAAEIEKANLRQDEQKRNSGLQQKVDELLGTLTEREREIIQTYYGISDNRPRTLDEVAQVYDTSRERVRQIQLKAMQRLRHPSRGRQLASFLKIEDYYQPLESDPLKIQLDEFELSFRLKTCLERVGAVTLGDVVQYSGRELCSYRNFAEGTLSELNNLLGRYGLRLKGTPEKDESDPLKIPLDHFQLGIRARRLLMNLNALTLDDVTRFSEQDLMNQPNFGQTSLNEVKVLLEKHNLRLKDS
ncbi:MAG: sigma-70 family RNA polymerase sigma factor [Nanoarchaeota archaeon]